MQIHFNLSIFFYHKRAMESLMLTEQVYYKKTYNELVGNRTIQFLLSISRSFIRSIRELQLQNQFDARKGENLFNASLFRLK